jgi:hypothetical protein
MDIYEHISQMKSFIASRDWDGLEREFGRRCRELAGVAQADRISGISLSDYQSSLERSLSQAVAKARAERVRGLYFEYDLDNDWQSGFFFCPMYLPESVGDDDWACDYADSMRGPEMPVLSEIYCENHFDHTPTALGSTLFLVARTVAAFGRVSSGLASPEFALCIAFHDQTPIMRIYDVP